jgi:hypothetical protein
MNQFWWVVIAGVAVGVGARRFNDSRMHTQLAAEEKQQLARKKEVNTLNPPSTSNLKKSKEDRAV